jgi:hypothetical protein
MNEPNHAKSPPHARQFEHSIPGMQNAWVRRRLRSQES